MMRIPIIRLPPFRVFFALPIVFFIAKLISSIIPATRSLAPWFGWASDRLYNGVAIASFLLVLRGFCTDSMGYHGVTEADIAGIATPARTRDVLGATTMLDEERRVRIPHGPGQHTTSSPAPRPIRTPHPGKPLSMIVLAYMSSHRVVSIRKSIRQNVLDYFMFFVRGIAVDLVVFTVTGVYEKWGLLVRMRRPPVRPSRPISGLPTVALRSDPK